ncbi:hypothetical protein N9L68_00650 [bacterium]|nr:hypothetical protein [bacterium]
MFPLGTSTEACPVPQLKPRLGRKPRMEAFTIMPLPVNMEAAVQRPPPRRQVPLPRARMIRCLRESPRSLGRDVFVV